MWASRKGHAEVVKLLLAARADVRAQSKVSERALHCYKSGVAAVAAVACCSLLLCHLAALQVRVTAPTYCSDVHAVPVRTV
jgi:ankyrin repeat protein